MIPVNESIAGRDLAQARLNSKVAAFEARTVKTLDSYQGDIENLKDYIVPLGEGGTVTYNANGHVQVIDKGLLPGSMIYNKIKEQGGDPDGHAWTLHPHASTQLGERLGIPGAFLRDMVDGEEWQRKAAADLLEAHTQNTKRDRFLFRAVNDELRGVLSDSYKRIDSLKILREIWENAKAAGAVPVNATYSDTRFYAEFINPRVVEIPTSNNGTRYQAFGLRVQNSDFGDGALDVRFLMIEAICYNGAVVESAFRQIHLGGKLPDNLQFSEDTYRLDSATTASQIKDITRNLLSTEKIREEIMRVQQASDTVIDMAGELKKLTKNVLGKGEVETITELLSNSRAEDGLTGAGTRFKLSQAVGTLANLDTVTPVRARELQEIAGAILGKVSE